MCEFRKNVWQLAKLWCTLERTFSDFLYVKEDEKKIMKIRIYFFPCQAVVRCDNFFFK